MKNSLVSVIIPIYNTESYLLKCVNSIINQTYKNLEIILINDGSTDNSKQIIDQLVCKDSRIICIDQQNMGQAISRNVGIYLSQGEFILFVDSDDFLEIDTIEVCIDLIDTSDIIIFGVNNYFNGNKMINLQYKNQVYRGKDAYRLLLLGKSFQFSSCNKLFRSSLLKVNEIFFPNHRGMEDYLFVLKAFFYSNQITVNQGLFYNYTQRVGSTSKFFDNSKIANTLEVIQEISLFVSLTNQNYYKRYFINLYYSLLFDTLSLIIRYSDPAKKNGYLKKYFGEVKKLNIYSLKNWMLLNIFNLLRFIKFKIYDIFTIKD